MTIIADFLTSVTETYASGIATEHSYRPAIQKLINSFERDITALNEPKRIEVGAPDLIVQRKGIALGYVEAKDLHIGLRGMKDANKAQQQRYLKALPNLIYTNCLDWDFYRDGELYAHVTIADFLMGVQPRPDQFEVLENLLRDFLAQRPQTITSPKVLAEIMAGKAALIKDVFNNTLKADNDQQSELAGQFKAFREQLIHDITPEDFADIYAETIAYGMFAARLHDHTLETFSRQEALDLLPKSNPFLRSLFSYIAGPDLDDRIRWIIDDLANVFQAADVKRIMAGFGELTGRKDPFLHFYETFLAAYNPAKRKARGVWYTPEAVVNFIVRAVDEVLQTEFGLPMGLADTSKVTIDWETGQTDKKGRPETIKKEVHRVQILDPATGTGTFLAEVIKQIAPKITGVAPGMWSSYIEKDLIPRLHGFELLMASYAMCHMKLDMILTEMGYKPTGTPPRLSVYLTNSLEEGEPANQALPFAQWLSNEVKAANTIKRDMPIMCVIGNPPYSGESANKGDWIMGLMEAYKKEPGGKEKLKERNPKWINDDYVKFIRFSEHLIEKNGEGVLGFITNHGYLDNPTFRGMRWHLMKTFDKIYVLDLHGNSKKKEVTPEGKPDKNVFDIMQGVAIIIGVKRKAVAEEKPLAEVFHGELWGSRASKVDDLEKCSVLEIEWEKLRPQKRYYMFYPIDNEALTIYDQGIELAKFMPQNQIGFQSHRDGFAVAFERAEIERRLSDLRDAQISDSDLLKKYGLEESHWNLKKQRSRAYEASGLKERIVKCSYRPFDIRFCMLDEAMMDRPRWSLMRNAVFETNFALNFVRQTKSYSWQHAIISEYPAPAVYVEIKDGSNFAPLYEFNELDQSRRINFDPKLFKQLQDRVTRGVQADNSRDSVPPPAISGRNRCLRLYLRRIALPGLPGDLCRVSQDRLPAHSLAA
ncbi:type ISP restriction/modification enzyme [Asticcacaulis taihuensis]|uniref:type ISP restriction/modification enzyme n=1 Tax=Asticcacaulis taihuensis TaxID=260084 RepID=UPI003F7BD1E2